MTTESHAMYSTKRRKTDDSTATLKKPFRSPLKKPSPTKLDHQVDQEPANLSPRPTTALGTSSSRPALTDSADLTTLPILATQRASTPKTHDSDYTALQKQHSALMVQLSRLNQSLDMAQQALKIEHSDQDSELESLVVKWRSVAREAAEELFSTARDRVNKMGGIDAWREKTQTTFSAWGDDQEIDEDELNEEQREALQTQREEAEAEAKKYGLRRHAAPPTQDNESFTIDMMLKQLNVDLDVIGYDNASQRWFER